MVIELTAKNFETEVLQSKLPVIVDFWASWCGPCKMLTPVFEEVSKQYSGKLKFTKISTEDFPTVAEDYGVMGIPCLIVFNHGEEVDRIIGFAPKEVLKHKIEAILEKV
ncbi:MAG: thioredoxin [Nanoarchaeota archaeon]